MSINNDDFPGSSALSGRNIMNRMAESVGLNTSEYADWKVDTSEFPAIHTVDDLEDTVEAESITSPTPDQALHLLASTVKGNEGIIRLGVKKSFDKRVPAITLGALAKTRENLAKEKAHFLDNPEDLQKMGNYDSFEDMVVDYIIVARQSASYIPESGIGSKKGPPNSNAREGSDDWLRYRQKYEPISEMIDMVEQAVTENEGKLAYGDEENVRLLAQGKKDSTQRRLLANKNQVYLGSRGRQAQVSVLRKQF